MGRADWMRGRYGLMYHYLVPELWDMSGEKAPADPEAAVRRFDLDAFLRDFDATGADWLIFTLGQNTGLYDSPNAALERYAGPGHVPERDLALEIAQALRARGKRFIAYLPSEIRANTTLHRGFDWTEANAPEQKVFQARWREVIAEWAARFGSLLDGWWFDGCYPHEGFLQPYMEWDAWYEAARAGNPDAAVTFNDGCYCVAKLEPIRPEFDYFAGEAAFLHQGKIALDNKRSALYLPDAEFIGNTRCRTHVLAPVDCFWAHNAIVGTKREWLRESPYTARTPEQAAEMEPPYCTDDELFSFASACRDVGAGVTYNVGCFLEGTMGEKTRAQIERLRVHLAAR